MLSLEAVHERLIWEEDCAVAVRLLGAVGGVESEKVLASAYRFRFPDLFPAASIASTQKPYLVFGIRLLTVKDKPVT